MYINIYIDDDMLDIIMILYIKKTYLFTIKNENRIYGYYEYYLQFIIDLQ